MKTACHRFRLRVLRALVLVAAAASLGGCVVLTTESRGLVLQADGTVLARAIPCGAQPDASSAGAEPAARTLDPQAIRITSWNIHKEADPGWMRDLGRFAQASDVLLLQEVVLQDTLRAAIEGAGLRWSMASSFLLNDDDIGVLTAARAAPRASCIERAVEPLLGLPKSALITWFRMADEPAALAIVNLHAINFTLTLGAYRAQLETIAGVLASHRGPIVLAGDFNTWNDARLAVVHELAQRLGLEEVTFAEDRRSRFLGRKVDHVFVRGLAVVASETFAVESSDHHPVAATLRLAPGSVAH